MKIFARKVRTDNGPGYSHIEYSTDGIFPNIFIKDNGNMLEERNEENEVVKTFLPPKGLDAWARENCLLPRAAFSDGGIHTPGTGYSAGEWLEFIETYFVVYDLPAGEASIEIRVKNDIWSKDNPQGWTYQGLGSANYKEYDSLKSAQKAKEDFYNGK